MERLGRRCPSTSRATRTPPTGSSEWLVSSARTSTSAPGPLIRSESVSAVTPTFAGRSAEGPVSSTRTLTPSSARASRISRCETEPEVMLGSKVFRWRSVRMCTSMALVPVPADSSLAIDSTSASAEARFMRSCVSLVIESRIAPALLGSPQERSRDVLPARISQARSPRSSRSPLKRSVARS